MDDTRVFVDAYLSKLQADYPAVGGDEARAALQKMYDEVSAAAHGVGRTTVTVGIFSTLRERFLADLEFIRANGLSDSVVAMFRENPAGALFDFLNTIYTHTLEHVSNVGGVPMLVSATTIHTEPELSAADELLLNTSKRGQA